MIMSAEQRGNQINDSLTSTYVSQQMRQNISYGVAVLIFETFYYDDDWSSYLSRCVKLVWEADIAPRKVS